VTKQPIPDGGHKGPIRRLCQLVASVSVGITLAACAAHYTTPFIPVTFSLDSSGHFSVTVGLSITTPLGTFSADTRLPPLVAGHTRVTIARTASGTVQRDVFDVGEHGPMT
jgi:hypothetical protein